MEMDKPFFYHALKINEDVCIGCSHCMVVCPTEAIRVWNGTAIIDENKCVDCGECQRVCPVKAIYVEDEDFEQIFNYKYRVALFPTVFIGQFPEEIKAKQIYSVMKQIGFTHVFEVEQTVELLNTQILRYQENNDNELPVISSFCPAIIRLIQVKYPSLIDNILRTSTPGDIAAMFYRKKLIDKGIKKEDIGIFYITPCAAKIAAVRSPVGEEKSAVDGVINMNNLYNKVYKKIKQGNVKNTDNNEHTELPDFAIKWSLTRGEALRMKGRTLAVDGIRDAIEFLDMVENEEVGNIDYLECRACKEGCAGGILNTSNRFLVVDRLKKRVERNKNKKNIEKNTEIEKCKNYLIPKMKIGEIAPRSMMILDTDMETAMLKMQNAKKIEKQLPGIDCGACGAPSCKALAEDIVKGDATHSHCVFVQKVLIDQGEMNIDTVFSVIEKIWGNKHMKNNNYNR